MDEYKDDQPSDMTDDRLESPASELEDDDCFIKLKAWFKGAKEHSEEWRSEAKEDYAFAAGNQWTDEERTVLKDQMRPIITFNRIAPVLDSVGGIEVSNRQEVRYLPRTEGDVKADEILSAAADWFRDQCDAEDEESDAFMDVLTCGMGWTETRLDFEEDQEGAPVIDRTDPLEMFWDPNARKRNIDDARFVFRVRRIPKEDALALIPGSDETELDAAWALGADSSPDGESQEEARFYRENGVGGTGEYSSEKDLVTIVECQWWERESVHQFADPMTGEIAELDDKSFKVFAKRAGEMGMEKPRSVTMSRRKYYRAYLGAELLLKEESPFQGHFSYKCITGKRDRNSGTYFGLVRQMKDPQRWANKWLSQTLHIMNTSAKGGIIVEDGIAEDMRAFEATYARPDAITKVKQGALSGPQGEKFRPKPGGQFPAGYFNLMEFAISSVRDATGVNLELLGMADRQQAGVLEAQRKRSAMAILANLFDGLRRYRKSQGRLLMQIITEHLSDNRLVRVVGEEGAQYVPLIRRPDVATYDVIVDDAPASPHQRDMTWQMLQQMLPMVQDQMTPELWSVILKASPLPSAITEKIQQIISAGAESREKTQAEAGEIGKAQAIADVEETRSKAQLNLAKAGVEGVNAEASLMQASQPAAQPQGEPPELTLAKIEELFSKRNLNEAKAQSEGMNAQANLLQALQPERGPVQ